MRIRRIVPALAVTLAAGPAFADCGFGSVEGGIDLSPAALIDPYGGNIVSPVRIPIEGGECGRVVVRFPEFAPLLGPGGAELPVRFGRTHGAYRSDDASSRLVTFPTGADAVRFDVAVLVGEAGVPRSGRYGKTFRLEMYRDGDGTERLDTVDVTLRATVDETMTLLLDNVASDYMLDLGSLVAGTEVRNDRVVLRAISNDPYEVTFDSANGWKIVQDIEGDAAYAIPYTLRFAGRSFGGGAGSGTARNLDATDGGGSKGRLVIIASPDGNLRAGPYQDEVTVTITGISGDDR